MKAKFATEQFPWTEIDKCDYVCIKGDVQLRVEQMDKQKWWWHVGSPYVESGMVDMFTNGKWRAIGLAEGYYLGLQNKDNGKDTGG